MGLIVTLRINDNQYNNTHNRVSLCLISLCWSSLCWMSERSVPLCWISCYYAVRLPLTDTVLIVGADPWGSSSTLVCSFLNRKYWARMQVLGNYKCCIIISCNDFDRLQIFNLVKHSLILISNFRTCFQTFALNPLYSDTSFIKQTEASLFRILISFVNNFWLNIDHKLEKCFCALHLYLQ